MKALGLDIASKTGWAVAEDDSLIELGLLNARDERAIRRFVTGIWEQHPDLDLVAIEAPIALQNGNTTIMLAKMAGALTYAFSERCPVHEVHSSAWRSQVLGMHSRAGREALKAGAVEWVRLRTGRYVTTDEADAACIAFWATRNARAGAL